MGREGSLLRGIRGRWRACCELVGLADPPEGLDGWHSGLCLSMPNIGFCPALRHSHFMPCCLGGAGQTEWPSGRVSLDSGNEFGNLLSVLLTHDLARRGGWWSAGPCSLVDVAAVADQWKQTWRWSRWCFSSAATEDGVTVLTLRASPRSLAHLSPQPLCPCAPGSRCGCRQRAAWHRDKGQMAWSRSTSLRTCMLGRVLTGDAAGGGQ